MSSEPEALDVEELRDQVRRIAGGVSMLRDTGITDRALLLLIQHAMKTDAGKRLNTRTISRVLDGLNNLEEFVFGNESEL